MQSPRTLHVTVAFIAIASRAVEIFVNKLSGRLQLSNGEWRFLEALESCRESLQVRDFAGHQELKVSTVPGSSV